MKYVSNVSNVSTHFAHIEVRVLFVRLTHFGLVLLSRRNRKSEAMRSMVRENVVRPANFIYPLFIHEEVSGMERRACTTS